MKTLAILLSALFLLAQPAWAVSWDIETGRGTQRISEGDTLKQNSFKSGQLTGINDITFYRWNFARETLETVFVNCTNITLIDCNLVNVLVPTDGSVININCQILRKKTVGNEEIYDTSDGDRLIQTLTEVEPGVKMVTSSRRERTPANETYTIPEDARTGNIIAGPGFLPGD